jgi:hypothetical protein
MQTISEVEVELLQGSYVYLLCRARRDGPDAPWKFAALHGKSGPAMYTYKGALQSMRISNAAAKRMDISHPEKSPFGNEYRMMQINGVALGELEFDPV